jgi:hypothetical protein
MQNNDTRGSKEGTSMNGQRLGAAFAIGIAFMGGTAMAQSAGDRVFSFHSNQNGGCPALDWHMVLAPDNSVSGMLGWQHMQVVARVTGSFNAQAKTFQLSAQEVGGNRTATISGNVIAPGQIKANIKGPGVDCENLEVWAWTPSQKGPGGAGKG